MQITFDLTQINDIAKQIIEAVFPCQVIALYGEMGAGKTTLTNALCKVLGVTEHTSSPTYALIQEYDGKYKNNNLIVCHTDWYRLKKADDLLDIGMQDYFEQQNTICIIEWPSVAEQYLPNSFVKITLNLGDNINERIAIIENVTK